MRRQENGFDLGPNVRVVPRPSGGYAEERRLEAGAEHKVSGEGGTTVVVCLQGTGTVTVARETFLARPSCVVVLSDDAVATIAAGPPPGMQILAVHWPERSLATLGPTRDGLDRTRVLYGRASVGLGWRISDELRLGDPLTPWAVDVMANGMAVSLTRGIRSHPPPPPLAARARKALEQSGRTPASISDIARRLGCTPEHLSRVFRRSYGMTPSRFLMWRRIERAKRVLLSDTRRVGDIAHDLGFRDTSHLSRHFRAWTGTSPAQFRARQRSDDA